MKITLTELSTDGAVSLPDCPSFGQCRWVYIQYGYNLETHHFHALCAFHVFAFGNNSNRNKVTINKQVVLQVN